MVLMICRVSTILSHSRRLGGDGNRSRHFSKLSLQASGRGTLILRSMRPSLSLLYFLGLTSMAAPPDHPSLVFDVEVVGMPVEIGDLRQRSAANGWEVTCTASAGDQQVMRVHIPTGITAETFDPGATHGASVGSEVRYYQVGEVIPKSCTSSVLAVSQSAPENPCGGSIADIVLVRGELSTLKNLQDFAAACGLKSASIWPLRQCEQRQLPHPDSSAPGLAISKIDADRIGPLGCFVRRSARWEQTGGTLSQ